VSELATMRKPDGTEIHLSRGAAGCLKLLLWYANKYRRVHPGQAKLASALHVGTRQLRNYLAELREADLISVEQGGDGRAASYTLAPEARSVLRSRLTSAQSSGVVPPCFHAGTEVASDHPISQQAIADENFRAELAHHPSPSSLGTSCSNQSESPTPRRTAITEAPATEPFPYENAQDEAIARNIHLCGGEVTRELLYKLRRKAAHFGETGFAVAAAIYRAWRRVEGTSNTPRNVAAWVLAVVESEFAARRSQSSGIDHRPLPARIGIASETRDSRPRGSGGLLHIADLVGSDGGKR
jgi:hypothetical protein